MSDTLSSHLPGHLPGHLFVMGFSNDPVGALSDVMLARIETAARLHRRSPHMKVIVTGGHGDNFNRAPLPHRAYANAALLARGVPTENLEANGFLSANTVEDVIMILRFAAEHGLPRFGVVTSAFHMERGQLIFSCLAPPGHDIVFHAAEDPVEVAALAAHEDRARALILAQGGVMVGSRLHALPGRPG